MRVLITGSNGFVGRNLTAVLKNRDGFEIYPYDIDTDRKMLDIFTRDCEFVFHLAGVNRPENASEFMEGNFGFTSELLKSLKANGNKCSVLMTSSIQAGRDNPYGKSKKAGEDLLFSYSKDAGVKVYCYRLPNLFGKWSRPNYNTVVATFCYNVSRGIDIVINDPETDLELCFIDDVIKEFIKAVEGKASSKGVFYEVPVKYDIKLGRLAELIRSFRDSRKSLHIPDMSDPFINKLYSTYLSFLPEKGFAYDLCMNTDMRGSFTEFIRTGDRGQVSVNLAKPGITKGNHWHMTKSEKFLVVSGEGLIRFRKLDSNKIIEYNVNGRQLTVVDIPPGYTHSISNAGKTDLITIMWASETFDPENPDTYFLEV